MIKNSDDYPGIPAMIEEAKAGDQLAARLLLRIFSNWCRFGHTLDPALTNYVAVVVGAASDAHRAEDFFAALRFRPKKGTRPRFSTGGP